MRVPPDYLFVSKVFKAFFDISFGVCLVLVGVMLTAHDRQSGLWTFLSFALLISILSLYFFLYFSHRRK